MHFSAGILNKQQIGECPPQRMTLNRPVFAFKRTADIMKDNSAIYWMILLSLCRDYHVLLTYRDSEFLC